jgi:uncharacterized tellurite resistance protein B-like protein
MSLAKDLEALFADGRQSIIARPDRFADKLGWDRDTLEILQDCDRIEALWSALKPVDPEAAAPSNARVAAIGLTSTEMMSSALASVGLASAAMTPVGWAVGSGIAARDAETGISRLFSRDPDSGQLALPAYLRTPMELIGACLAELMIPVSCKLARADGEIHELESRKIREHYLQHWGYSPAFIERMVSEYLPSTETVSYAGIARSLLDYCDDNADCDRTIIAGSFVVHLREVIEADGTVHERERDELDLFEKLLSSPGTGGQEGQVVSDVDGAGRPWQQVVDEEREEIAAVFASLGRVVLAPFNAVRRLVKPRR